VQFSFEYIACKITKILLFVGKGQALRLAINILYDDLDWYFKDV